MAEFTSAEKVNIGYENEYSTDAMTGGPDKSCLLYTSPSPRDVEESRMPSSA